MKNIKFALLLGLLVSLSSNTAFAQNYEVTITNITKDQQFTPTLVASHRTRVSIFELGTPASSQLETLAEGGNTAPLQALLEENSRVREVGTSSGLLNPGQSVTISVSARRAARLSLASMLIPTNDAFVALNAVEAPRRNGQTSVFFARAYDAGTEINDELCASIPGPNFAECSGPGGGASPTGGEEGFVHVHNGVHGIGDLITSQRDWRGAVARVSITRVR